METLIRRCLIWVCTICLCPTKRTRRGSRWLSGRVLDSRPKGRGFEPHRRHCVVSLSKNINPSLVLVKPRKTRPFITERLLMRRKESNKQTNKQTKRTLGLYGLRPIAQLDTLNNDYNAYMLSTQTPCARPYIQLCMYSNDYFTTRITQL